MIQGFYTAKTAVKYIQYGIDVTAHNIANANTVGFKKSTPVFKEALQSAFEKEYPADDDPVYNIGNGSHIGLVRKDMSQGALTQTGRELDLAVNGEGFLTLIDAGGNVSYTRGGSFFLEHRQNRLSISDGHGNFLVDRNMNIITLPSGVKEILIRENGTVTADGTVISRVNGVLFDNPEGLLIIEKGLFNPTDSSGEATVADIVIHQGRLEMSNVDLILEMTELIKHQRMFQMNAKIISVTDELDSMANKLRK